MKPLTDVDGKSSQELQEERDREHNDRERQAKVIADIRLLQEHTIVTGFRTTRAQNDILAKLNGPDLVAVLRATMAVQQ
jgi:hypothetical protein